MKFNPLSVYGNFIELKGSKPVLSYQLKDLYTIIASNKPDGYLEFLNVLNVISNSLSSIRFAQFAEEKNLWYVEVANTEFVGIYQIGISFYENCVIKDCITDAMERDLAPYKYNPGEYITIPEKKGYNKIKAELINKPDPSNKDTKSAEKEEITKDENPPVTDPVPETKEDKKVDEPSTNTEVKEETPNPPKKRGRRKKTKTEADEVVNTNDTTSAQVKIEIDSNPTKYAEADEAIPSFIRDAMMDNKSDKVIPLPEKFDQVEGGEDDKEPEKVPGNFMENLSNSGLL